MKKLMISLVLLFSIVSATLAIDVTIYNDVIADIKYTEGTVTIQAICRDGHEFILIRSPKETKIKRVYQSDNITPVHCE